MVALKYIWDARVIAIAALSRGVCSRVSARDDEGEVFCKYYKKTALRGAGMPTAVPINNNPRFDATTRVLAAAILHLLSRKRGNYGYWPPCNVHAARHYFRSWNNGSEHRNVWFKRAQDRPRSPRVGRCIGTIAQRKLFIQYYSCKMTEEY